MSNPLHPVDHAKNLERDGHRIVEHIQRDDADRNLSNPAQVKNGFYRISQRQNSGAVADASLNSGEGSQEGYPVVMNTTPQLRDRVWCVREQHGVKNGFTIVPQDTPTGGMTNPEYGGTACVKEGSLYVKRSSCFPIWNILYQNQMTVRIGRSENFEEITYFSVWEVGKDNCWTTDEQGNIKLVENKARLTERQLFEFVAATNEQTLKVSSVETLSVTASDATPIKKLYFGTSRLKSNDIARYLSLQLETDAHDQGWATYPDRGLWSWFELAIFRELPAVGHEVTPNQIKSGPEGEPLTWISHRVPLKKEYVVQRGEVFTKDHELFQHLEEGDHIGVLACAQYARWEGAVRKGTLIIQEMGITGN